MNLKQIFFNIIFSLFNFIKTRASCYEGMLAAYRILAADGWFDIMDCTEPAILGRYFF